MISGPQYRPLGATGLQVSALALGTVALGTDYGIAAPEQFGRPEEAEAVRLIREAADAGINLFDTAPTYGESERLLGKAIGARRDCYIATKVSLTKGPDGRLLRGEALRGFVRKSLENSLRDLHRDVLDIVQIHNATVDAVREGDITAALLEARRAGKVRFLGASVYTADEALAAIEAGCFQTLQVAYNILDQRMAERALPAAFAGGIGVLARSCYLKGALTEKAQWLPPELARLRDAAERVCRTFSATWSLLPDIALRFCLSSPHVATVLVGVRTSQELKQALAAARKGPLPKDLLARTPQLALDDARLVDPRQWPVK